jgi:ribosomal protein L40E
MKWSNKFMNYFLVGSFLLMMITPSFAQQQQVKETVVCSDCNAENPLNAKFCSKCGSKLAEQIIQPEPEEKILESIPPVLQDESLIEPELQKEIAPKQKEALEPPNADELKARAIYDSGKALFRLGAYEDAALQFERLILEYPATNYAEASLLMLEACKNILVLAPL